MFLFRFIILLALPVLAYIGLRKFAIRYSLNQKQFNMLLLLVIVVVVVVGLIVLGRLPVQFILAPIMVAATFLLRNLPLLLRFLPFLQAFRKRQASSAYGSASEQGNSVIRTKFLSMTLDHETGVMDGEVLLGQFKGDRLSSLSIDELMMLLEECDEDSDSCQVLEAYLDRTHASWRGGRASQEDAGRASSDSEAPMTESLALEILGLHDGASRDEIVKAHRKLMQKMHPDRGGSDYLAQRINAARDYLLR
ncbi:MAG: DnaJ domain-containing protein [Pseudohongiellaceae bacterium]|nr:DnaJ domain-containing protein [Pseudohongiellaceae bacterium]